MYIHHPANNLTKLYYRNVFSTNQKLPMYIGDIHKRHNCFIAVKVDL